MGSSWMCVVFTLIVVARADAQATDTSRYTILLVKGPSGHQKAWTSAEGTRHYYIEYSDRGRGPALAERVTLGPDGYPRVVEISGHDYNKVPVSERFVVERSGSERLARWKNSAESTAAALKAPAFYFAMNDASVGLLESLLLKSPNGRVALLPQGEARLERIRDLTVSGAKGSRKVTLYATHGLDLSPRTWWADDKGSFFASGVSSFMVVREGFESAQPALLAGQATYDSVRGANLAKAVMRRPRGAVVFRNANLFDAETGRVRVRMTVVVRDNRIAAVGSNDSIASPSGAETIDVGGKTLLPGLWDMHVHLSDDDGLLHLAAGVTTVRDIANDIDETLRRRKRFDDGTLLGPRVHMGGFMDGPGPLAGPNKVLVSTPDSARAWVNRYADLGYAQIKIYGSLDTALVPIVIAEAHRRGLRVSGHVPKGMIAEEFVRAGADELQHVTFPFLNFWRDSVMTVAGVGRLIGLAERAALLDLDSERVQRFIELLRERGTVIDPTIVAFEGMLVGRPGVMDPGAGAIADRLPPLVRRLFLSAGLPMADSMDQRYRDSFRAFGRMVKAMYDRGVSIVPGTDHLAGFMLHRELELYASAGIPRAEVLRMATINSAKVMKRDKELGSIAAGKLADLIIVDGHPEQQMSDIRRVTFVMKNGRIYDPAAMYRAVGIQPVAPY